MTKQKIEVPKTFYRVSTKALIYDESKEKFAVVLEDNGWWELLGGGLDWGEDPLECLKREISEEAGLEATWVSSDPVYCLQGKNMKGVWSVALVYEVKVKDFNFKPSEECIDLKFISPKEASSIKAWRTVTELAGKIVSHND